MIKRKFNDINLEMSHMYIRTAETRLDRLKDFFFEKDNINFIREFHWFCVNLSNARKYLEKFSIEIEIPDPNKEF